MNRLTHSVIILLVSLASFVIATSTAIADQSLVNGQTSLETPTNHGGFPAFAFSPDGKLLAGGTGAVTTTVNGRKSVLGAEVLLWNARTGKLLKTLGKHGDSVRWVGFAQDGETLVSASRGDGVVKVWQMPAGRLRHTLRIEPAEKSVNTRWPQITLSDDGQTLVTISARSISLGEESHVTTGGELAVWDLTTGEKLWSKPESDAYAAALTPDGRGMVTVNYTVTELTTDDKGRTRFRAEHRLLSWQAKSGKVLATADLGRLATPQSVALLDGESVALVTSRGLSVRNRLSGEESRQIEWHKDRSFGEAQLADDGGAVGRAKPGWIEIVDVESGETKGVLTTEFPNHFWNVAFSSDLTRAAAHNSGSGGGPFILELATQ